MIVGCLVIVGCKFECIPIDVGDGIIGPAEFLGDVLVERRDCNGVTDDCPVVALMAYFIYIENTSGRWYEGSLQSRAP
jgi:hypothetical protein